MKPALIFAFLLAMLTATAHAQVVGQPLVVNDPLLSSIEEDVRSGTSATLKELENPDSTFYKERGTFTVSGARAQVLTSAARGVGIRGGYAEEAQRINDLLLQKYRRALDAHYNIKPLMLQNGFVVPPAITQINQVKQLSGPNYLYLTTGSFEIVRDARLTTITPTWIDWLVLPIRDVRPPENLKMENDDERLIWRNAVRDGWETGIKEARLTFTTALATLHRDYHGMRLYHRLAQQGAVSVPSVDVNRVPWRVTEDGKRAFSGETTLEIQVASKFRR